MNSRPHSRNAFSKSQPGLMLLPQPLNQLNQSNIHNNSKNSFRNRQKIHSRNNSNLVNSKKSSPISKHQIKLDQEFISTPTPIDLTFKFFEIQDEKNLLINIQADDNKKSQLNVSKKSPTKRRPKSDFINLNNDLAQDKKSVQVDVSKDERKKGGNSPEKDAGKKNVKRPHKLHLDNPSNIQSDSLLAPSIQPSLPNTAIPILTSPSNPPSNLHRPSTPPSSIIPATASLFSFLTPPHQTQPSMKTSSGFHSLPSSPAHSNNSKTFDLDGSLNYNVLDNDDSRGDRIEIGKVGNGKRGSNGKKRERKRNVTKENNLTEPIEIPKTSVTQAGFESQPEEDEEEVTSLAKIFSSSLPLSSAKNGNHHARAKTAPQGQQQGQGQGRRNRNRSNSQADVIQKGGQKGGRRNTEQRSKPSTTDVASIFNATSSSSGNELLSTSPTSSSSSSSDEEGPAPYVNPANVPLPESPVKEGKPKISRSNTLSPKKKERPATSSGNESGGLTWQQQMLAGNGSGAAAGGRKQRSLGNLRREKSANGVDGSTKVGVKTDYEVVGGEETWEMDGITGGDSFAVGRERVGRPNHRRNLSVGPGIALGGNSGGSSSGGSFSVEESAVKSSLPSFNPMKFNSYLNISNSNVNSTQYAGPKFNNSPEPSGLPRFKGTWDGSQFV